jgi:FkbM family methyltransferase
MLVDTSNPFVTSAIKAMLFWGLYEGAELRFIRRYLRQDLDVVELGGSIGVVTCQIRKLISPDKRLICVEANPELIGTIENNLRLNDLVAGVSVLNFAIGYDDSHCHSVPMDFTGDNVGGHVSQTLQTGHTVNIPKATLSRIIEDNRLSSYVLVSDIEGAEAGIAIKDRAALRNCEQIIIELHDTVLDGVAISAQRLYQTFAGIDGFELRASYGPVYVFENSKQLNQEL